MENTATIEGNGEHESATTAPTLRNTGRNIDGFFRPRATITPRVVAVKTVENSVAALAAVKTPLVPSAPEIDHATVTLTAKRSPASRGVNHTHAHTPQEAHARVIKVSHPVASKQELTVHRVQPNHVNHHAVQRSKTLRRDAVPAPELSTHNLLNPKSSLQHKVPSLITTKKSAASIDTDRLARASGASKSPMVAHHAAPVRPILPIFTPVTVQPTPGPAATPVIPPPTPGNGGLPPAPAPQPDNKPGNPVDIFEHALANADHFVDVRAHRAHYQKKARVHIASMLAGSLALIVIATVIAYQNSPVMQLKFASVEAGVTARMPDFSAAGFSYDGVRAGDSKLTFGFKGHAGTYQLTQTDTNLSDVDMIQTIGSTDASGSPIYQVVMAGNTMVYRFNNTNATWVSNGKWYTVSGSNALTNQQVQAIVQHV